VGFEFDPEKSTRNKGKHGIDFEQAQALWDDAKAIEIPSNYKQEERIARIAKIGDKTWTAIFTHRQGNIRIISVRRARGREEEFYEKIL
jgi:uncharacterized protein